MYGASSLARGLLEGLGAADHAGCRWVTWVATGSVSINEAVIGSLSRQDEDLLDACLHWSSRIVEFRKASAVNSTRRLMPGDCRTRWDSVACNRVFLVVWFLWERCEALQSVAIVGHVSSSTVKSGAENGMEVEIWELVMVVRDLPAIRNWIFDSWLGAVASASGGDSRGGVQSMNFRVKPKVWS
jgi:hypothetical protein